MDNLPQKFVLTTSKAERRFLHRQPGLNGLGQASKFARELHKVAPDLYRLRLT